VESRRKPLFIAHVAGFFIEVDMITIYKSKGDILLDDCDAHLAGGLQIKPLAINKSYLRVVKSLTINGVKKKINLARIIMSPDDDMCVDHINHNPLDNRRCNLRVCTRSENRRNGRVFIGKKGDSKSIFKGVTYCNHEKYRPQSRQNKHWRAYTRVMGKRIWFGYFETEQQAAMAYNRNAFKLFGEFACYNRFDTCPLIELLSINSIDYPRHEVLSA
jgi:hypothetical protein